MPRAMAQPFGPEYQQGVRTADEYPCRDQDSDESIQTGRSRKKKTRFCRIRLRRLATAGRRLPNCSRFVLCVNLPGYSSLAGAHERLCCVQGRTEDAVKSRWKALNPNQKTYQKLGRPRLIPTADLDNAASLLAANASALNNLNRRKPSTIKPSPTKSILEPIQVSNQFEDGSANLLPEPFDGVDQDEPISDEDLIILRSLLLEKSNKSLDIDGGESYRSILELMDMVPGDDDQQNNAATAFADVEDADKQFADPSKLSKNRPRNRTLRSLLSLGSSKSLSLRDIVDTVDPEDRWINHELRQLSGMSIGDVLPDIGDVLDAQDSATGFGASSNVQYGSLGNVIKDEPLAPRSAAGFPLGNNSLLGNSDAAILEELICGDESGTTSVPTTQQYVPQQYPATVDAVPSVERFAC